jgi:hypothetical protein
MVRDRSRQLERIREIERAKSAGWDSDEDDEEPAENEEYELQEAVSVEPFEAVPEETEEEAYEDPQGEVDEEEGTREHPVDVEDEEEDTYEERPHDQEDGEGGALWDQEGGWQEDEEEV